MASRKNRKRKRRSSTNRSSTTNTTQESDRTPEPKYVTTCKQLMSQITGLDDSKPFHTLLAPQDRLYKDYRKLNSKPISFKTIRDRLYQKQCYYPSYDKFNEDIAKIFYQETRLKKYKGNCTDRVKKRMQNAKRTENYWNTLTAPYTEYGFDAIINAQSNDTDDSKEGEHRQELIKSKNESKKQKKNKRLLSNIKKRVKRSSDPLELGPPQPPFKRRRLNDNRAVRSSYKPRQNKEEVDDDDDAKQEMDQDREEEHKETPSAYVREGHVSDQTDSPFTPFAEKSRVFNDVMGNTEELFKTEERAIKKRLHFNPDYSDDHKNHNNNMNTNVSSKYCEDYSYKTPVAKHHFEIKWRYDDDIHHREARKDVVEASRMDNAVKQFKGNKSNEQ
eukprot:50330_1